MERNMEWKLSALSFCDLDNKTILNKNEAQIRSISSAIQRRETEFVQVIEELEPVLSSTNVSLRQRGTKLLLELLRSLPNDFLTLKEVDCLASFLIIRLHDHHTIVPNALQGLLALSKCTNLPEGFAADVITAIFKEVHVPSQLQSDRYAVYKMISYFLCTCLEELKRLESMVLGFIQILDGEREPRCLMLAFSIVPELVKHFDLGPFAEDLFEVLECYFPIDFNPREGNLSVITREDLATALHKCLILTPKFANFCIKLLIDKWEDSNISLQLDILHVLESSCNVFGKAEYEVFLSALWNIIRKGIFFAENKDVETAALGSLTSLVRTMSEGDPNEIKKDFIGDILTECRQYICQTEHVIIPHVAKIVEAVSLSSIVNATRTSSYIIPLLLEQYPVQTQIGQRKVILEILVKLFSSFKQHKIEIGDKPLGKHSCLVFELLFSVLDSTKQELCVLALAAFSEALCVNGLLEDSYIELLASHLVHLLLSSSVVEENIRLTAQHFLSQLTQSYPFVTQVHIMPALKKNLSEYSKAGDNHSLQRILDAMKSASSHSTVIMDVLETIITFLRNQMHGQGAVIDTELAAKCLLSLAIHQIPLLSLSSHFLCSRVIEPLVVLCLNLTSMEQLLNENMFKSVEHVGDVVQKIAQSLDSSSVIPYLTTLIELTLYEKLPDLPNLEMSCFQPNENGSIFHEVISLLLLKAFLCSANPNCNFPHDSDILGHLVKAAVEGKSHVVLKLASHSVAVIANKKGHNLQLSTLLSTLCTQLTNQIGEAQDGDSAQRQNILFLWIWITKALLLSGHPQMSTCIKQLILWFQSDSLGTNAAKGFSTIVEDSPEVFSIEGHACIKFLYRQRFFVETSPHLYKGYDESPTEYKANYLIALCSQLKYLPKTVLLSELPSVLPMLLHALHNSQSGLQLCVLVCLEDLLKENPLLLEDHLNTLVPRLLTLTCGENSMKIKIHSLSCLISLCPIPGHLLLPLKQQVIKILKVCLDDKKRLVRKAAAQARGQWYLIGEAGN